MRLFSLCTYKILPKEREEEKTAPTASSGLGSLHQVISDSVLDPLRVPVTGELGQSWPRTLISRL